MLSVPYSVVHAWFYYLNDNNKQHNYCDGFSIIRSWKAGCAGAHVRMQWWYTAEEVWPEWEELHEK